MRYVNRFSIAIPLLLNSVGTFANDALLGHWAIEVVTPGQPAASRYELTVEREGEGFVGYVYNGPVPVSVDGDAVEIDIDWVAGTDVAYVSTLRGSLNEDGALSGIYDHHGAINFMGRPLRNGSFTGIRIPEAAAERVIEDLPPDPVDISGVWNAAFGFGGFSKLAYAMTGEGAAVRAAFSEMDAPHIRCAGYGLITTAAWTGTILPLEIFQNDEQITFVLGADVVRRIYLDDREYPGNREATYMGFSKGRWKGSTLEVITTRIKPSFLRAGHGNPVSANAYTREYFTLDEDGFLNRDMWLHDPENYTRPPYIPRVLDKSFAANVITKMGCDPYSYFRQMHMEGELETYFGRGEFRR